MARGWVASAAVAWAIAMATAGLAEDYRLQAGDVVRVVVPGVADLDERATVDIDGRIRVPLGGAINAAGRTLDEVAEDLRSAVSGRALQVMGEGGRPTVVQIASEAVSVSLDGYRPVFVDGDVRAPGAFDFAPGLTARRALALAGGLGYGRYGGDPELLAADAREELAVVDARAEAARERVARLRAILADPQADAGDAEAAVAAVPEGGGASLGEVEAQRLGLARADLRAQAIQIEREAEAARARLEALERQLAVEESGAEADEADFERLEALRDNGRITADRLSDARRSLLFSATRRLQVDAEAAQAAREVQRLVHEREILPLDAAAGALEALSLELAALDELDARRRGLAARLAYAGAAGAMFETLFDTEVRIQRVEGGEEVMLGPDEDAPLRPGDLVRVVMTPVGNLGE